MAGKSVKAAGNGARTAVLSRARQDSMKTKNAREIKTPVRRRPHTGHHASLENHQPDNKTSVTGRPHLTCLPKHRDHSQYSSENPCERWQGLITQGNSTGNCACQPFALSDTFTEVYIDLSVGRTDTAYAGTQPRWHATANARPMPPTSAAHRACRQEKPSLMMNPTKRHSRLVQGTGNKYSDSCQRFTPELAAEPADTPSNRNMEVAA